MLRFQRLLRELRKRKGQDAMSKVVSAHAVSVDGYITGRDPGRRNGLGDGGQLFDWYFSGDTPSQVFRGFKMAAESAPVFDDLAARLGAVVAGRHTYDDSNWITGGGPHPNAALVLCTHREIADLPDGQTQVTTGIADAVAAARERAGGKDVGLMGGGVLASALEAGLVDEVVLHQVPVLLGAGRPFFGALPEHVQLRLIQAVPTPGVTHLHYEVVR
jgi:dihydrofolate reductase